MIVNEITTECEDGSIKIEIIIDDKKMFSLKNSDLDSWSLNDNFDDCYIITHMMELAYNAGKNGEKLIITKEENEE
ncbi:hypothetical protein [Fluviispira vulneris]|uniref:hypothetical protein n=1 Tax=Fluviispira vulneris TaxID=2763012 RepID=UPI001647056E|nr:hypothetical protein [Fluviispira vulneris]